MKKYWKEFLLGGIIILFIIPFGIAFLTNFKFIITDTYNGWIGFWGSYLGAIIGGICTVIGVYWTIKHTQKIRDMDIKQEKEKEVQKQRILVKPYIQSFTYIKDKDIIERDIRKSFVEVNESGDIKCSYVECPKYLIKLTDNEISLIPDIKKKYFLINYEVCNVGIGSAVNLNLTCNDGHIDGINSLSKGESILIIFIIDVATILKKKIELKLIFNFEDICEIGSYKQEEIIKLAGEQTQLLMYAPPGLTPPELLNEYKN